jgi:hypothetical protein
MATCVSLTTSTSQYVRYEEFRTAKSTDCHPMCHLVDGSDGVVTTMTDGHLSSSGAGFVFPVLGSWTHCTWQSRFWVPTLHLNTAILLVMFLECLFVLRHEPAAGSSGLRYIDLHTSWNACMPFAQRRIGRPSDNCNKMQSTFDMKNKLL